MFVVLCHETLAHLVNHPYICLLTVFHLREVHGFTINISPIYGRRLLVGKLLEINRIRQREHDVALARIWSGCSCRLVYASIKGIESRRALEPIVELLNPLLLACGQGLCVGKVIYIFNTIVIGLELQSQERIEHPVVFAGLVRIDYMRFPACLVPKSRNSVRISAIAKCHICEGWNRASFRFKRIQRRGSWFLI